MSRQFTFAYTITGLGTTLLLVGAYILAGELTQNTSVQDAFEQYERIYKPRVEVSQKQISLRAIRLLLKGAVFDIENSPFSLRYSSRSASPFSLKNYLFNFKGLFRAYPRLK